MRCCSRRWPPSGRPWRRGKKGSSTSTPPTTRAPQDSSPNPPGPTHRQARQRPPPLPPEALFKALLRQEKDGGRLGEILITEGQLTEEQLLGALRANAEEHVYDLFLWPDGHFDFRDNEPPGPNDSKLGLPVRLLVDEGRHRLEAWDRTKKRFPSAEVTRSEEHTSELQSRQ